MREGGKKNISEKNIELIYGKVIEVDKIKKNIGQFFIKLLRATIKKNTFDLFKKSYWRRRKNKQKK